MILDSELAKTGAREGKSREFVKLGSFLWVFFFKYSPGELCLPHGVSPSHPAQHKAVLSSPAALSPVFILKYIYPAPCTPVDVVFSFIKMNVLALDVDIPCSCEEWEAGMIH